MARRTTIAGLVGVALLAANCREAAGPERAGLGVPRMDVAAASGIAFDTLSGTVETGSQNVIIKGFDPRNPHLGDAIIATVFWTGTSSNVIDSVTDHFTMPGFPRVGNTYHFVEYSQAGDLSMATYVATNVQGFPDAFRRPGDSILAVMANFSTAVTVRGIAISAWSGVAATFAEAVGGHRWASGTGSTEMDVGPGGISVNAGALAYGVTMSNAAAGRFFPAGFGPMLAQGNGTTMTTEADSAVQSSAGSVDPKWHWFFGNDPKCTPSTPCTWLASILALNPAGAPPPNQPPTANFPVPSCSALTCNFTSTSSDPDGTIASYSWNFGDGATSTAANPSHSYTAAGTYTVTLTVTDNQGTSSAPFSRSVAVSPANQAPTANFTFSCSALSCNFTSTSSDPDGSIASYSWTFGDGGTSTAANPSHSYTAAGTYSVGLRVTDNQGAQSTITTKSVTVTVPNQAPTANFTFSCSGLGCNFTSTSSDPDGSISAYSWTFGDGATSTLQNPSHTYTAAGTYSVGLRVTDNQGAQSTITTKSVTVTAPNSPPVVNAGADQSAVTGLLYSTSFSFSDANGNGPWSYRIDWGDGNVSTGTRTSQGSFGAGHTYIILLPRSFTIRVTVTDAAGASGSDTKVVTLIL